MKKYIAGLLLTPLFAFAGPANNTGGTNGVNGRHEGRYEPMSKEYCTSGQSGQDVNACLKEFRNSRAEKMNDNHHSYKENSTNRCLAVPQKERGLCEERLKKGVTSGSVKEGGTITELTQTYGASSPYEPPRQYRDQNFRYDSGK